MRKFIFILMLATVALLTSCEDKKQKEQEVEEPEVESLIVENVISTNREDMFLNYGENYRWFETCILMKDFMDEETDGSVEAVTSIFQVITEEDTGFDTHVVMMVQTLDTNTVEIEHGFWVEDFPLNDENITITFEEAFNLAMEVNCVKPHSRHCVLRREIGPKIANAQYIFGNSRSQIYVDANTGEVSEFNPAVNGPLSEWP